MIPTLEDTIRVAREVVAENPDTVNPLVDNNPEEGCTYFGPNGTSCVAGTIILRLGGKITTFHEGSAARIVTVNLGWPEEVGNFLSLLQRDADNRVQAESGKIESHPMKWGELDIDYIVEETLSSL